MPGGTAFFPLVIVELLHMDRTSDRQHSIREIHGIGAGAWHERETACTRGILRHSRQLFH